MRALLVLVCILAASLAGCFGGNDAVSTDDDGLQDQAEEVTVTATTGSIRGTVASELFEPLGGAQVGLVEAARETLVARNGEFVFNDVAPGRYTVNTAKDGYLSANRAVDVVAGEVAEVSFQLVLLASEDPYVEEREHVAIINMGGAWEADVPVVGCQTVNAGLSQVTYNPDSCGQVSAGARTQPEMDVTDDVKTILVEMIWRPAGPLGEYLKMDLVCPLVPRGLLGQVADLDHVCYFPTTSRESPIIHRIDEPHWAENDYNHTGTWVARVFPSYGTLGTYELTGVDVGVTYEQSFAVLISIFHREGAPEGYSAIADV